MRTRPRNGERELQHHTPQGRQIAKQVSKWELNLKVARTKQQATSTRTRWRCTTEMRDRNVRLACALGMCDRDVRQKRATETCGGNVRPKRATETCDRQKGRISSHTLYGVLESFNMPVRVSRWASIRVSAGFTFLEYSSPSFGSQHMFSYANLAQLVVNSNVLLSANVVRRVQSEYA